MSFADTIAARGRSSKVSALVAKSTRFKRANLDQLQLKSRRRHQTRLDSALRTNEHDFGAIVRAQFLRDRQGGNNMSAGTASSHNHTHGYSVCCEMLSSTPTLARVMNSDEPP